MTIDGAFTVPIHGQTYCDAIVERCYNLIDFNIWDGIDKTQLRLWLNNFTSEEEKYFAACVLDCLIYRSEQQSESLFFQLFYKEIPNLIRRANLPISPDIINRLRSQGEPKIRLVSVMLDKDPPIKSSSIVARILKRSYQLNQTFIIKPIDIKAAYEGGIREFVFIDDFLGTGDQFDGVLFEITKQFDYKSLLMDSIVIYAPLVAHSKGIKETNKRYPHIHLVCAEILDEANSLFAQCFDDGVNSADIARKFYLDMLNRRSLKLSALGYGDLELTFAFQHGVPDNSLGILHFSSDSWTPLIKR